MKKIQFIAPLLTLLALFTACEDDRDMTIYDESKATPAQLESIESSYVLDAQKESETAITFGWSKADMGYQAVVTYNIEMAPTGDGFTTKVNLATTESTVTTHAVTTAEINAAIMKLMGDAFDTEARTYDFRIAASIAEGVTPLYSNVVSTTITPYSGEREYPQIWVIGDYCNWDHASSQFLYSAEEDENYAGMIYFDGKASNGWKLTPQASWDAEWAGEGTPAAEASTLTLVTAGGGNLTNYAHTSYYFEFNSTTGVLKVSQPHDSWGVVGEFSGWSDDGDVAMTLASETKNGKLQHYLTATIDLEAGKGWKIRPDYTWTDDRGPGNLKYEGATESGGNFVVAEDGNYTIKWYFNKVEPSLEVIKN